MDKNEELQKWLNDDRYVRIEDMATFWNHSIDCIRGCLRKHTIKPKKQFFGRYGRYAFYNKKQCNLALAEWDAVRAELRTMQTDNKYVRPQQLTELWGIADSSVAEFLQYRNIQPVKKIHLGPKIGNHAFYDRAECERARPFINQPEQKEVEKVGNIGELATATKHQILIEACADDFVWDKVTMKNKIMPVKNYCDERGNFISLFKKDETVSAILAYKNEQKQLLEKCLADDNLLTTKMLERIWDIDRESVYRKIKIKGIKPYATVKLENGNTWKFYKRSDCIEFYQQINNTGASNECLSLVESDKYNPDNHATMKDLMKFTGKSRYMIMQRFINKGITPISKPLIGKTVSYVYDLQQSLTVLSDVLKPKYRKLIAIETKEIKTVEEKQMELPEPKEQTPDIIPADTIDLFTMSELEAELKNRGVELTTEVRAKINASDMPEMQHIATMMRGNTKTIAIRLSVLNEIAEQLVKSEKKVSWYEKIMTKLEAQRPPAPFAFEPKKEESLKIMQLTTEQKKVFCIIKEMAASGLTEIRQGAVAKKLSSRYNIGYAGARVAVSRAVKNMETKGYVARPSFGVVLILAEYIDAAIAETRFTPKSEMPKKTTNIKPKYKLDLIMSRLEEISLLRKEIAELKQMLIDKK